MRVPRVLRLGVRVALTLPGAFLAIRRAPFPEKPPPDWYEPGVWAWFATVSDDISGFGNR
jgi:hypothetical protein